MRFSNLLMVVVNQVILVTGCTPLLILDRSLDRMRIIVGVRAHVTTVRGDPGVLVLDLALTTSILHRRRNDLDTRPSWHTRLLL